MVQRCTGEPLARKGVGVTAIVPGDKARARARARARAHALECVAIDRRPICATPRFSQRSRSSVPLNAVM